ncbi:MAG: hypothetical protein AB7E81_22200 [Hyphomicrobiaceae bacterium]
MNGWPPIVTACWSTPLPSEFCRIGISRGPPRGQKGYRRYERLAPGPWMRWVGDAEFIRLYFLQLSQLDPG